MSAITTTTWNDIYTTVVENRVLEIATAYGGLEPLIGRYQIPKGGILYRLPLLDETTATALGQGSAYGAVGTSTTSGCTITAGMVGLNVPVNTLAWDAADINYADAIAQQVTHAILKKRETDICTLFSSITGSVSATGCDMTVAGFLSGIYGVRNGGFLNHSLVAVLDPVHVQHLETAIGTGSYAAFGSPLGEKFLTGNSVRQNVGMLMGVPIFSSIAVPAANTSDLSSAIFVPASASDPGWAALGELNPIQIKGPDFQHSSSSYEMTVFSHYGVSEVRAGAAYQLVYTATAV